MTAAGPGGTPGDGLLVHGMGRELVRPDWAPLTEEEAGEVLAAYGLRAGSGGARITWRSVRPMSAAALARVQGPGAGLVFLKRHDVRVRTAGQLAVEHAFAGHLRRHGQPVPAVLRTPGGASTVRRGDFVYEAHGPAAGIDLYREATSWSPFASASHARAAGAALARLHEAAAGFARPARPPGVLTSSCAVITAADPLAAVGRLAARRPALARYLRGRPWQDDLARHLMPAAVRAGRAAAGLRRRWGHEDWHPSNLTWTCAGPGAEVAGVFDLGLANRTFAVHDLATALERSTIGWLDLAAAGTAEPDLDAADALLGGYEEIRPLDGMEAAALPEVLPVAHLEYALSEVEYFSGVVASPGNADLAYHGYLIGHARWFAGPQGSALLDLLRRRAGRR